MSSSFLAVADRRTHDALPHQSDQLGLALLPHDVIITLSLTLSGELNGPALLAFLSACSAGLAILLRSPLVVDRLVRKHRHPRVPFYRGNLPLRTLQEFSVCEGLANLGINRVVFRQQSVLAGSRARYTLSGS
jgi:hypothetical protein